MPGIVTSSKMSAGLSAPLARERAFSAVVATFVLYLSFKTLEITAMLLGASSTIRMSFRSEFVIQEGLGCMDGFALADSRTGVDPLSP